MVKLSAAGQWMDAGANEVLQVNGLVTQQLACRWTYFQGQWMATTKQLVVTVGQLPWSARTVAYLCTPGANVGAQREELEGAWLRSSSLLCQTCLGVERKVLWQWNTCDSGRLEELAAASTNSTHRQLVSGHSLLAEQQQARADVQVSRQPYLGSTLPATIWGSPYKR